MKQVLAVIDTNVIVSAFLTLNPDSPTVLLVEKMFDGAFLPVVNDEIIKEYREVLMRPKFRLDTEMVTKFVEAVSSLALHLDRSIYPQELPDPKDRVFYEVSLTGDAYLVTGNKKHFPSTTMVVSPAEMLTILL